ncbi:MAG: hypothetical protein NTV00_11355 [Methylococcales bacterium]|nr:hypothetical protein [Methylococcales bacterium]
MADTASLKTFTHNSYQQLLKTHKNQAFALIIWSINCPICLAEMSVLSELHLRHPSLNLVMLATDDHSAAEQIRLYLEQYELTDLEQWQFITVNNNALRTEIDPNWRGEVPRSYFFDRSGRRTGITGFISLADFKTLLTKQTY